MPSVSLSVSVSVSLSVSCLPLSLINLNLVVTIDNVSVSAPGQVVHAGDWRGAGLVCDAGYRGSLPLVPSDQTNHFHKTHQKPANSFIAFWEKITNFYFFFYLKKNIKSLQTILLPLWRKLPTFNFFI